MSLQLKQNGQNMDKFTALFELFRLGHAVIDPALWKMRQISANIIAGIIMAAAYAARSFGIDLPVTDETAIVIAGGVLAVINMVLTVTTSKTIGFPPAPEQPQ
jgi:hypothetical protein